jgi:hypothetical protein
MTETSTIAGGRMQLLTENAAFRATRYARDAPQRRDDFRIADKLGFICEE